MNDTITNDSNDTANNGNVVTSRLVPESERMAFVDNLFGLSYVLKLEPIVFRFAEQLAENYDYGYWQFYSLSNGGFYMAPRSDTIYNVSAANGFEGQMTADALGLVACFYAFSNIAFGTGAFAQTCANQYHLLREYMFGHAEVRSIVRAID